METKKKDDEGVEGERMKKETLEKINEFLKDGNLEGALDIAKKELVGNEDESANEFIIMGVKEGEKGGLEDNKLASLYFRLAGEIAKDDKIKENAKKNYVITHNTLGNLLHDLKRYEEAEKEYREAIRIDPKGAGVHSNLGLLLQDLKRYEEAEQSYREAIRIDPNLTNAHYNLGNLLYALKRYEESEKEYREAIRIDPNYADAHNNRGNLLQDLKRYEEAEQSYREAIRITPNLADAHYNLGNLLAKQEGREKESEQAYREAIRINPSYAGSHNNLGILLHELKRYEEAEREYLTAIQPIKESKEEYAIVHANLGQLYLSFGDMLHEDDFYEDALVEFKQSLPYLDDFAVIHNNIGYAFTKLKRFDDAKAEFRKSTKLDPLDRKVRRNIRRIEKLIKEKQDLSRIQNALYPLVFVILCLAISLLLLNWNSSNFIQYAGFVTVFAVLLIVITVLPYLTKFKFANLEFEKESGGRTMGSETISAMERLGGIGL